MEADCAHKLPGRPLCGTTECETGLFRQEVRKTPFYKHYIHYKFLTLYELLMFLEYFVTFRYLEALPWFCFQPSKGKKYHYFVCIHSKIFNTINHTFFLFYMLRNHIFDGSPYTVHRALPVVTLVIVPLNSVIWTKVGHQCKSKSGPKLWCATITPCIKHRVIVEVWRKLLL